MTTSGPAVADPEVPVAEKGTPLSVSPPARVERPVMVQQWVDVVFVHWPLPPDRVQRLLPAGVEVDTFEGRAWVGLVPFRMEGLGFPGLSPLPVVGTFPEVNVRTYVRSGARRGVWFFSLDVDRFLPALVARAAYGLPYCRGRASHERSGDHVTSSVRRTWPATPGPEPTATIEVRTADPLPDVAGLESFLTSRWGLISSSPRGTLRWAPVEHPRWPLFDAQLVHLEESLTAAAGLTVPDEEPHVMWSPGVPVRVGRPVRAAT